MLSAVFSPRQLCGVVTTGHAWTCLFSNLNKKHADIPMHTAHDIRWEGNALFEFYCEDAISDVLWRVWVNVKYLNRSKIVVCFFFGYSLWLPLQFALKFSQAVAREFFLFPSEWYLVKPQLLCWDRGLFERWVRPRPSQHLGGKRICGKCQQVILA